MLVLFVVWNIKRILIFCILMSTDDRSLKLMVFYIVIDITARLKTSQNSLKANAWQDKAENLTASSHNNEISKASFFTKIPIIFNCDTNQFKYIMLQKQINKNGFLRKKLIY